MTHSQYVDAAAKAGKGRLMHPETKMAHEAGTLDTYVKTSSEEASKDVFPGQASINQPSLFPFATTWGPHPTQKRLHSREEVAKLAGMDPSSRDLYADVTASSPHEANEHLKANLAEAQVHAEIDAEENPNNNNKALGKLMSMGVNTEYRGTQRVSDRGDLRRGRQFRDVPDVR
jgi:FtsZ-interacting cell division protein ZipA